MTGGILPKAVLKEPNQKNLWQDNNRKERKANPRESLYETPAVFCAGKFPAVDSEVYHAC